MLKIKGNGLISKSLNKNLTTNSFEIFAAGVSNSNEESIKEFNREIEELLTFIDDRDPLKTIIYFSTYSIDDPSLTSSKYNQHKLNIENIIKKIDDSLIMRLPNVIGDGGNPNTMFNYFKESIKHNKQITVLKNAFRNFIDVNDISCFINNLGNKYPQTIKLIHPISYNIIDIVTKMGYYLNKNVLIKKIEGGENYIDQPTPYVYNIMKKCDINSFNDIVSTS